MTKTRKVTAAEVVDSIVDSTSLVPVLPPTLIDEQPQEPQEETPTGPTLYVDSPIKKALFDQVLRAQMMPGGRWGGPSQARLAAPWTTITVVVDPDKVGRNFEAQKGNWNFNDSNYVNQSTVYPILARVAREANNGQEVPKKVLVGHLEDLKLICQKMAS